MSPVHLVREAGRVTDVAGFTSIVVALDLAANGDRALPIVRALANRGDIAVKLFTVSSPHVSEDVDRYELSRRAKESGWSGDSYSVAHSNHPARAIIDFVEGHDRALLVMATSAKPPITGHLFGNVVEEVLGAISQPVLLVGPHVPADYSMAQPTLVLCVDRTDVAEAAIPAVARWVGTFGGADTWVTEVIPTLRTGAGPAGNASAHVRNMATRLGDEGVTASWGVLHGDEPDVRLEEFGDRLSDPVFVATSVRWTDGRLHWRSTTHQLVHRSSRPVLVVPAKQSAGATGR